MIRYDAVAQVRLKYNLPLNKSTCTCELQNIYFYLIHCFILLLFLNCNASSLCGVHIFSISLIIEGKI